MKSLSHKKKMAKRKGIMGKGYGKSKKHTKPNPYIFSKERWVVIPPGEAPTLAFFNEEKALKRAATLATLTGLSVEVDHEVLDDKGNWISKS